MEVIQSQLVRRMIESASNHIQNQRKQINDLNVFPVPDGDTGTNMSRTFGSAAAEALSCGPETGAGEILDVLARASLRNARGNSGVILSQILRGLATGVHGRESLATGDLTEAVCQARDTAYRAVMRPTEGTILTVIRETAEFAQASAGDYPNPVAYLEALLGAARASLERTPEALPALKQAGVVDAGGMGLVVILEGMLLAAQGKPVKLKQGAEVQPQGKAKAVQTDPDSLKYLYCTEFLVHKTPDRQAAQLTAAIKPKGDCMLVIEDEEVVKVHIHTNHPGFVIEQALKLGELTDLKIDNMKYQHEERFSQEEAAQEPEPSRPAKRYGFVAVSAGPGLDEVFRSVGVDALVPGGQTMNPSAQELLDAVQEVSAETVFLLPNNKNIILAAEQVRELTPQQVAVIPTRNIPQGISAMLAFDQDADLETNRQAMQETAAQVKCGQLTFAARDSSADGLEIHQGDILGMLEGAIAVVGQELNEAAEALVNAMIDEEAGVITVYYGQDVEEAQAQALLQRLRDKYEYLDVSLLRGGQPVYYYLIAVE